MNNHGVLPTNNLPVSATPCGIQDPAAVQQATPSPMRQYRIGANMVVKCDDRPFERHHDVEVNGYRLIPKLGPQEYTCFLALLERLARLGDIPRPYLTVGELCQICHLGDDSPANRRTLQRLLSRLRPKIRAYFMVLCCLDDSLTMGYFLVPQGMAASPTDVTDVAEPTPVSRSVSASPVQSRDARSPMAPDRSAPDRLTRQDDYRFSGWAAARQASPAGASALSVAQGSNGVAAHPPQENAVPARQPAMQAR